MLTPLLRSCAHPYVISLCPMLYTLHMLVRTHGNCSVSHQDLSLGISLTYGEVWGMRVVPDDCDTMYKAL